MTTQRSSLHASNTATSQRRSERRSFIVVFTGPRAERRTKKNYRRKSLATRLATGAHQKEEEFARSLASPSLTICERAARKVAWFRYGEADSSTVAVLMHLVARLCGRELRFRTIAAEATASPSPPESSRKSSSNRRQPGDCRPVAGVCLPIHSQQRQHDAQCGEDHR